MGIDRRWRASMEYSRTRRARLSVGFAHDVHNDAATLVLSLLAVACWSVTVSVGWPAGSG